MTIVVADVQDDASAWRYGNTGPQNDADWALASFDFGSAGPSQELTRSRTVTVVGEEDSPVRAAQERKTFTNSFQAVSQNDDAISWPANWTEVSVSPRVANNWIYAGNSYNSEAEAIAAVPAGTAYSIIVEYADATITESRAVIYNAGSDGFNDALTIAGVDGAQYGEGQTETRTVTRPNYGDGTVTGTKPGSSDIAGTFTFTPGTGLSAGVDLAWSAASATAVETATDGEYSVTLTNAVTNATATGTFTIPASGAYNVTINRTSGVLSFVVTQ